MSNGPQNSFFRPNGSGSSSASGGTGKNYLSVYKTSLGSGAFNTGNGDLELGSTTGFGKGTVGTLTNGIPTGSPTFGSGSNANLSIATANSNQLAGAFSLDYISAAATTVSDCLHTDAFFIDSEDQSKVLGFKFAYKAQTNPTNGNFSGTSSNSFGVAAYDVTNSSWLGVAGQFNIVQSSGIGYATGTFQTNSTTASIRFIIYNVNASAGAITMRFDDFVVGPQVSVSAPAISDWVSFTPTGSWSTNTTYAGKYRQVGDSVEVQVNISLSGAPTSATLTVNLPSGMTIDTAKLANGTNSQEGWGQVALITGSGTTGFFGQVFYSSTTAVLIKSITAAGTASYSSVTQAVPGTFGNGDGLNIWFTAPIVGRSSNSVSSADTDTRVVAARANNATATVTSSYSNVTWVTVVNDTHGAMGAINYTIPVTGYYDLTSQVSLAGTQALNGTAAVQALKNGVALQQNDTGYGGTVTATNTLSIAIDAVLCSAGDTISIQVKSSATLPVIADGTAGCYFCIARRSGPAVITATESVNGRYFAATATITGSFSLVTNSTKDFDSHAAYSAGTLTVPVSGKYQFNAAMMISLTGAINNAAEIGFFKNGTQVSSSLQIAGGSQTNLAAECSDIISCLAGDAITVKVLCNGTSPTVTASNFRNYFSWARVGN